MYPKCIGDKNKNTKLIGKWEGVPVFDWFWGAYESDVMPKINGATAWSNLAKLTDGLLATAVNFSQKHMCPVADWLRYAGLRRQRKSKLEYLWIQICHLFACKTPRSLVNRFHSFGSIWYLSHQGRILSCAVETLCRYHDKAREYVIVESQKGMFFDPEFKGRREVGNKGWYMKWNYKNKIRKLRT